MIGQAAGHRWRLSQERGSFSCYSFVECLMEPAKVVGAANQVPARLKRWESLSSMATLARQGCKPFSHRPIEPLDVGGVEHLPASRTLQEAPGLHHRPMTHLPKYSREMFIDRLFDHRPNVQARPALQRGSTTPRCFFDFVAKCPSDALGVGSPSISADEQEVGLGSL
jgi:hypothetical protein